MRKFYVFLAVMMVFSLLLTACQQQTATTEAPVVEETTAPEEVEVIMNPYLGSNKLDGNGVPPTFFDDVHIRRAFAYAFDWDTVVNEVL